MAYRMAFAHVQQIELTVVTYHIKGTLLNDWSHTRCSHEFVRSSFKAECDNRRRVSCRVLNSPKTAVSVCVGNSLSVTRQLTDIDFSTYNK